jgi:hypothetical protein
LEAAAEYVMESAAEEVTTLQEGSESSAAAGLGVGFDASATSDAAGATSDAAGATSDAAGATSNAAGAISEASSSAFERSASAAASAASFSMKRVPSTSTALTGPVAPGSVRRLAFGWTHASVNLRSLVTTLACSSL